MAKSKVMHGARAVLWVGTSPVGVFSNVSYGVKYDVSPVFILGRLSAAELVYTGMEVIEVQASGFRVIGHGPHVVVDAESGSKLVPTLQELLDYKDLTISLHDRLEADPQKGSLMTVTNVKPTGFSTSVGARGLQEMSVSFMGLHLTDETATSVMEPSGAADLPGTDA